MNESDAAPIARAVRSLLPDNTDVSSLSVNIVNGVAVAEVALPQSDAVRLMETIGVSLPAQLGDYMIMNRSILPVGKGRAAVLIRFGPARRMSIR